MSVAIVVLAILSIFGVALGNDISRADDACVIGQGGTCQDYRDEVCIAGYASGLCDGDNNRKCCLPCDQDCQDQEDAWAQGDSACLSSGGACQINSNYCAGSYSGGLCGGPSNRQCCKTIEVPDPEFRAMFIASAFNVDWPTNGGESSSVQQTQMLAFLDTAAEINFNAVMFQVRPAADALYESSLEPWSKFLTGTQGTPPSPFYDPLEFTVTEAHARGIEVHVWLNPYRGGIQANYNGLAANHICNTMRQYCYVYDQYLWLDPGAAPVADHLIDVITDIVERYDIDGVHFDDYFYPYPDGSEFPDSATYNDYLISGGTLGRDDWRRDNVNKMVERVYNTVHAVRNTVKFSISPFGIYRPGHPDGMPSPITGLDPYEEQFADTKLWFQSGWVDFFAPQLYWKIDPPAQSYPVLLDWWLEANTQNRYVYAATALYRVADSGWPVSEIVNQVAISRDAGRRSEGSLGNIHYSAKYLRDNYDGLADAFLALCPTPVSLPPYPWLAGKDDKPPERMSSVQVNGRKVVLTAMAENIHTWAIHEDNGGNRLRLIKTIPREIREFAVERPGRYSVSGTNRIGQMGELVFFDVL